MGRKQAVDMAAPWREGAACRGEPPDLWFPERGVKTLVIDKVCARCEVTAECREFGWGERHGIWGSMRHSERRAEDEAEGDECVVCGDELPAGRWRWCSTSCQAVAAAPERPDGTAQPQLPLTTPDPLRAPVSVALRAERQSRQVTTRDAADRCGVAEARYLGWEDGRILVEPEQLPALARFLQTTVAVAARISGVRLAGPSTPVAVVIGPGQQTLIERAPGLAEAPAQVAS